jgi:hypothetical protein
MDEGYSSDAVILLSIMWFTIGSIAGSLLSWLWITELKQKFVKTAKHNRNNKGSQR